MSGILYSTKITTSIPTEMEIGVVYLHTQGGADALHYSVLAPANKITRTLKQVNGYIEWDTPDPLGDYAVKDDSDQDTKKDENRREGWLANPLINDRRFSLKIRAYLTQKHIIYDKEAHLAELWPFLRDPLQWAALTTSIFAIFFGFFKFSIETTFGILNLAFPIPLIMGGFAFFLVGLWALAHDPYNGPLNTIGAIFVNAGLATIGAGISILAFSFTSLGIITGLGIGIAAGLALGLVLCATVFTYRAVQSNPAERMEEELADIDPDNQPYSYCCH